MKRRVLCALVLLVLCAMLPFAQAVGDGGMRYVTLDEVRALADKGKPLTPEDLTGFHGEPFGEDASSLRYPLEEGGLLVVKEDDGLHARLVKHGFDADDERLSVDILAGDIDAYLATDTAAPLVEAYISSMQCPGACTYVVAIINLYPKTRDLLLALDYRALPALSNMLKSGERGRHIDMAEVFLSEILSRRMLSSFASDESFANEAAAVAAIEAYTGKPFKPYAPNPDWQQ